MFFVETREVLILVILEAVVCGAVKLQVITRRQSYVCTRTDPTEMNKMQELTHLSM